ncbi:heme-binding domain-containing protein [uncultured Croceitalea sp.]|uniref:heme-binding domain-containing protein n=1 Tax=uncultured Croceitalea sp. TaxID=1798908 RepID=UPI0033066EA7
MKIAKKILVALLVVFIGMQFFGPDRNVTDATDYVAAFEADTQPSAEVKVLLQNTCYDCHSNNTEYPWYSNISPVSYWIDEHIEHGKEELNFSDWANYSDKKKDHKLEELVEEVEEGEMPLKEYTWIHSEAHFTNEQKELLINWAKEARTRYQVVQTQD